MAQKDAVKLPSTRSSINAKKRKEPPTNASKAKGDYKRPKNDQRAKQRDARSLSTQTSSKAFKNGELDVDKFVKAREYEIRALGEGMARSKKALTTRAFQQVPKELRRRTASHNVKKVPRQLQKRAKREMAEDNTPTVTPRRRKPTRHMRLRLETAKKLQALSGSRRTSKSTSSGVTSSVPPTTKASTESTGNASVIKTRAARIKKAALAVPPIPRAKFRKRQIDKTWLPTHLFHAKRARMTPPKDPLWRFAVPLTPTAKSYRPTHRTASERGAIAWDTSYMSTIGLQGQQKSIDGMLKALGVGTDSVADDIWGPKGSKWRKGLRAWNGFIFERELPHNPIAPVTIIWSSHMATSAPSDADSKQKRTAFIRVHPSAFLQLWEELVRLGKVAKPQVGVEDLRFEIGSIEVRGPGATETLLGALWPSSPKDVSEHLPGSAEHTWGALAGLNDPSSLPPNVVLGFGIQDPRLHHPPRTIITPSSTEQQMALLETAAAWPLDSSTFLPSLSLFDRQSRIASVSKLSSQKAINRRKALSLPGRFPPLIATDPDIPTLVYSSSAYDKRDGSWIVLLPWKYVQPTWYNIMYYPLSSGGQPRFGGLDEVRQLTFERGQPWFPGDFPGTRAGWEWEIEQRKKRENEHSRRPKSKRVNWDAVKLGEGLKGEVGLGSACDWGRLLCQPVPDPQESAQHEQVSANALRNDLRGRSSPAQALQAPTAEAPKLTHLPSAQAGKLLGSAQVDDPYVSVVNPVITVRLACLTRGTPQTCARIYRLPATSAHSDLRREWLALHPRNKDNKQHGSKNSLPRLPKNAPPHLVHQRLAQSLIDPARAGDDDYPACPPEDDLIGFVTTGNFNLSEGRGTGIGNLLFNKVIEDARSHREDGRLCIIRAAGQSVGRLARWELV